MSFGNPECDCGKCGWCQAKRVDKVLEAFKPLAVRADRSGGLTMKTNYTPGPWEVVNKRMIFGSGELQDARIATANDVVSMPDGQRDANARLIAQAPAMAELLQKTITAGIDLQFYEEVRRILSEIEG